MTGGTRAAVVAFALANLYLLSVTGPLVSPQHELVFHLPGSANLFFIPAIVDVLLLSAALTCALLAARRHPRAELLLWSGLLLSLPSGLIATGFSLSDRKVPPQLGWPVAITALLLFIAANALPRKPLTWLPRTRSVASLLLSFLALPQLLLFAQMLWYGWQARDLNPPFAPSPHQAVASSPGAQPRVLWILLDELSFEQVYGHRYPGLQLPNFDRLASQSVVFTQAIPAAEYTRRAVPSMLTGLPLSRTQPSTDSRSVLLYTTGRHQPVRLSPNDTVFADARNAGLPTAVAGWYEPYCRLFPGVLDRCYWTYSDELPAGMSARGTLLQQTVQPFLHFARLCFGRTSSGVSLPGRGALDVRRHRADYEDLLAASDALLTSGAPGFTLIHMPIPHPWGFYDRHTATFSEHRTSYLDNLALADVYIGRVRAQLEQQGLWEGTNVLIMGDHSWRTASVWSVSDHWTAEEQAASRGGAYDPRPAVILKLSGQKSPARIDARFDAVRTRALIDRLIARSFTTPAELRSWVEHPEAVAPASAAPAPPTHPEPRR